MGELDGQDVWPLLVIGAVAISARLEVFSRWERYAKRHGKLKRSDSFRPRDANRRRVV
jgi:hypothetical protein